MRSVHEVIRGLFHRLFASARPQGPHLSEQEVIATLERIAETHEPFAVPGLVNMLRSPSAPVVEAAANAISRILSHCTPTQLAQIDQRVREFSEWRWPTIHPDDINRLAQGHPLALGVLSFNASGYVREATTRALGASHGGEELPFLLIRVNDWVRPVREIARKAVLQRVRSDYAPHLVRCLPLVYRLEAARRHDQREVVEAVLGLLRQRACREALLSGLASSDRQTSRLAFRLLVESPQEDRLEVLGRALESSDTVLRLLAAQELRRSLTGEALRQTLDRLRADAFMPVRREALYGFVENLPELAPAHLREALLDPHAGMREAARYYLRQLGQTDFTSFYRERLREAGSTPLPATVEGLGESGEAGDAVLIADFLRHSDPRVRKAAVRAIGRLNAEAYCDSLVAALRDGSAAVAKAARDVLVTHMSCASAHQLAALFEGDSSPLTQRLVLTLLTQRSWWESASVLLTATISPDERIRSVALAGLHRWQYSTRILYARPTRKQVEEVERALLQHGAELEEPMVRAFQQVIAYAKREHLKT
jgi:HEAT repeat protein